LVGHIYEYEAENGMTLREWVTTSYNVDGWKCSDYGFGEEATDDQLNHVGGLQNSKNSLILMHGYDSSYNLNFIVDCDSQIIPNYTYKAYGTP
jgi:hypothetical protein